MQKKHPESNSCEGVMAAGLLGIDKTWRRIKKGPISIQEYELELRDSVLGFLEPEFEDDELWIEVFNAHFAAANKVSMRMVPSFKRIAKRRKHIFLAESSWTPGESLDADLAKLKRKARRPEDRWKDNAVIQWAELINPLEAMLHDTQLTFSDISSFIRSHRESLANKMFAKSDNLTRKSKGSPKFQKRRVPYRSWHISKDNGLKIKSVVCAEPGSPEIRQRREAMLASNGILQAIKKSYSPNIKPSDFHLDLSLADKRGRFRNYKQKLAEIARLSRASTIEDFRRVLYLKALDLAKAIAEKRPDSELIDHKYVMLLLIRHVAVNYQQKLNFPTDLRGLPKTPQSGSV